MEGLGKLVVIYYLLVAFGIAFFSLACLIQSIEFNRSLKKNQWNKDCEADWAEHMKQGPDPQKREMAYMLFNGMVRLEDSRMTALRPQVNELVDVIYQHRMKLCARAGLDFEDDDLEGIVAAYEQMTRLCGDALYDQGWYDSIHLSDRLFKQWRAWPKKPKMAVR